jgi:dephospho-CoA kinase
MDGGRQRSLDCIYSSERSRTRSRTFVDRVDRRYVQAIQRTMDRDHLTRDDAQRRVNAQMSNQERYPHANVLLCTYWSETVTQKQIELAWHRLVQRI